MTKHDAYVLKRAIEFTRILAGYACAEIDQDADATTLCGKCGPCEANAFLRELAAAPRP